jgi:hypothetical protein
MFLIRILLFFFFLYLLLHLAGRIFALWFNNKSRKFQDNSAKTGKRDKKFDKNDGEYIPYEEIKDK